MFSQWTDALPPPSSIRLLNVSQTQLTFSWSSAESNCVSVQYGLQSDCGTCTNGSVTARTSKVCIIEPPDTTETQCSFAVRAIVCGNVSGDPTKSINVKLKGMMFHRAITCGK